jgi:translation elongation factor EF-G
VSGFVYRHAKQDGGAGQWAHIVLDVQPLTGHVGDTGFVFGSTVVGGRVPRAVLGDLAARRGRVTDSTVRGGSVVVTAAVPLAELFGYATRLRGRTHGRGTFTTRALGYAQRPASAA